MARNDGGPTFPNITPDMNVPVAPLQIDLRDWFAGQALAGSKLPVGSYADTEFQKAASAVYRMADAMLAARKDQP